VFYYVSGLNSFNLSVPVTNYSSFVSKNVTGFHFLSALTICSTITNRGRLNANECYCIWFYCLSVDSLLMF